MAFGLGRYDEHLDVGVRLVCEVVLSGRRKDEARARQVRRAFSHEDDGAVHAPVQRLEQDAPVGTGDLVDRAPRRQREGGQARHQREEPVFIVSPGLPDGGAWPWEAGCRPGCQVGDRVTRNL